MYHTGPNRANVNESSKPSLLALALGFMNIGLTSVGGAAGPLRHVIVKQRRWLSEAEYGGLMGIGQALPGAVAVNVAVMLGDRFAGPLGPLAALAGLIVPSLIIAITLVGIATRLAASNVRFAAAETAVTAAVAGIFIANGVRLIAVIWRESPDLHLAWRCARLTISALGIVLVVGFHLLVPVAMIILIVASMLVESRRRARRAHAQ